MLKARKANVVLKIEDDDAKRYLDLGWNVYDMKGHLVKEAIPSDLGALKMAYVNHTNEIAKLKAEIAKLKANKVEEVVKDKPIEVEEERQDIGEVADKPVRRKRTRK